MTTASTYGLVAAAEWVGEFDRIPRRFEVRQRGAADVAGPLLALAAQGGLVEKREAGHPFAAAVASEVVVRWLDGGQSAGLAALPYGEVQGLLYMDLDGVGAYETLHWAGYLVPGRYEEVPGERLAASALGFNCGLGALNDRAAVDPTAAGYDPAATATLRARAEAALAPLSSADGVHAVGLACATALRPTGAVGEPLGALSCRDGALEDGDGSTAATEAALVRWVAGRVGARLFLDAGAAGGKPQWRAVSRGALLSGPAWSARDGATVYADNVQGARRLTDPAPVAVEVHRTFQAPLDDLLVNGGFDDVTGSSPNADPEYWDTTADATAVFRRGPLGAADDVNRYALQVYDDFTGGAVWEPQSAAQSGLVVAAASPGSSFRWSGRVFRNATNEFEATATVTVGPHSLRTGYVEVGAPDGDVLKGSAVSLPCRPLLEVVGGPAGSSDSDAVDGRVVMEAGSVVVLGALALGEGGPARVTVKLTRPARVGDVELVGDLSETVTGPMAGYFCYFGTATGAPSPTRVPYLNAETGFQSWDARVPGTDVSGAVVGGPVSVTVWGPQNAPDDGQPRRLFTWDSLSFGPVTEGGRAPSGSVTRAAVFGAQGRGVLSLPLTTTEGLPFGDGPLPDSPGALLAGGQPTGPLSGGTWTVDHLPGTWPSADAALAADALAQFGVTGGATPVARVWSGTLAMRPGQRLPLDRTLTLSHPDGAGGWSSGPHWWDHVQVDHTLGLVALDATELRLADISSALVTYSLD